MAKGTPTKKTRNEKLIKLKKQGMTFRALSVFFRISVARTKQIYYRAVKKGI